MVTRRPRHFSRRPREDALRPFPRELATPPVTKMCLVTVASRCPWKSSRASSLPRDSTYLADQRRAKRLARGPAALVAALIAAAGPVGEAQRRHGLDDGAERDALAEDVEGSHHDQGDQPGGGRAGEHHAEAEHA